MPVPLAVLAQLTVVAQGFEATMLILFGFAWPVDIVRTLRGRCVLGKSPLFMGLVLAGYLAGMTAKLVRAHAAGGRPEWVMYVYILNAAMVGLDMVLYYRFCRNPAPRETTSPRP